MDELQIDNSIKKPLESNSKLIYFEYETIESLQAQLRVLTSALVEIKESYCDDIHAHKVAKDALSTVASDYLETERKREKIIKNSRDWFYFFDGRKPDEFQQERQLYDSVEALESKK